MNIKILGWYGHGNTGDEAFKVAFPLLFPGHNLEFVESLNPDDDSDLVILGGGDICYPSFTKYIKGLPPDKRKLAVSISLTSNSDFKALSLFEKVFVRDYSSTLTADRNGQKVGYLPDVTFTLTPDRQAGKEWLVDRFKEEGHSLYEKVVVCVVSNYLAHSKLDKMSRDLTSFLKLSQDISLVCDQTPASFIFLPFSTKPPWDDRVSNGWVADRCKYYEKNYVVWENLDVQTTLNIIAAADACVSSRLHSSIFSTIAGVPFIDLTHHSKNFGFLETVEKTEWSLPFWEFSIKDYRQLLNSFLSQSIPNSDLSKFAQLAKEHLRLAAIL